MKMNINIYIVINNFKLIDVNKFTYYNVNFINTEKNDLSTLFSDVFSKIMGLNVINHFQKNDFVLVRTDTEDDTFINNPKKFSQEFAFTISNLLRSYLNFLWLVKDHSVFINNVIVETVKGKDYSYTTISTHEMATYADGQKVIAEFTREEMLKAAELYTIYRGIIDDYKDKIKGSDNNPESNVYHLETSAISENYNTMPLIERALMFTFYARNGNFLPHKLSIYVQALECLFVAEGGGELQVKVSERVAFYLGSHQEREEIWSKIKMAYSIRSRYFHGDKLPKTVNKEYLMELCTYIDNILRRIFNKILLGDYKIFNKTGKEIKDLEHFLSRLIFQSTDNSPKN